MQLSQHTTRISGAFASFTRASPFPEKMSVKLGYTSLYVGLSTGATDGLLGTSRTFNLNGLYDPDLTGTGHQPRGFDQITALYQQYRVKRIDIKVTFTDPSVDGIIVCAQIRSYNSTSVFSANSFDTVAERQGVWYSILNNTGSQTAILNSSVPISAVEGLSDAQLLTDSRYAAFYNANPTNTPYLDIACARSDGTGTCNVLVELTYHADFFAPVVYPSS